MNKREFIRKSMLGGIAAAAINKTAKANTANNDLAINQVGHNHLPNKEVRKMNKVIHRAESRGHANHGWLDTHHTFSFANYYNPDRMNFGVLRVLNDDKISGGSGFGKHPHDNMEIISIPLSGALEHKDSMGSVGVIKVGDVQVMSAGTGVYHSEYNHLENDDTRFLQIWLFPNKKNVEPRYDQISTADIKKENEFYQILSPKTDDEGVWIHQNAWFNIGEFNKDTKTGYSIKDSRNGLYAFLLEGEAMVNGETLNKRDGIGLWDTYNIDFDIKEGTKILLMDVPMSVS
jgi:redox-sensitive bicupin YhaK (pirin superfamily)